MKRLSFPLLCLLALVVPVPFAAQTARTPPNSSHVVLISLDGFMASALDDPYLPLPALRKLAAAGAAAKTMRPVDPTVTWANHTSMITGVPPAGHGVIYNGLLIREPGVAPRTEPWRDRKELVHARTLYDAAHEKGLTTAQVDWVAIQNAGITWEFPERPDPTGEVAVVSGAVPGTAAALELLTGAATRRPPLLFPNHANWTPLERRPIASAGFETSRSGLFLRLATSRPGRARCRSCGDRWGQARP